MLTIERLDHLVLTVRDLTATIEFYTRNLGMTEITFHTDNRKALAFGSQKINLHVAGKEFEPKADKPTPGSGDLCFIVKQPVTEVMNFLQARGVAILEGPVRRTGALGDMTSIYFRDPDGNLIELSNYLLEGEV